MRRLGSQSLRLICLEELSRLGPDAIGRCVRAFNVRLQPLPEFKGFLGPTVAFSRFVGPAWRHARPNGDRYRFSGERKLRHNKDTQT